MRDINTWVAFLTVGGIIFGVFARLDKLVQPDRMQALGQGLANPSFGAAARSWRRGYIDWFDRLYGIKLKAGTPIPSLWASAKISSVLAVLFFLLQTDGRLTLLDPFPGLEAGFVIAVNVVAIPVLLVSNVAIDYLSVAETRLVGQLIYARRLRYLPFFLLIDLCLTLFFSIVVALFAGLLFLVLSNPTTVQGLLSPDLSSGVSSRTVQALWNGFLFENAVLAERELSDAVSVPRSVISVMNSTFATTVVTSIWLYLFLLSGFVFWVARKWDRFWRFLNRHLTVENNPGIILGIIAILVWTGLFWTLR